MVKLVSLSNDVYSALRSIKKENESFSQLIRRKMNLKEKRSLLDYAGLIQDETFDKAMKTVLSKRSIKYKRVLRFD